MNASKKVKPTTPQENEENSKVTIGVAIPMSSIDGCPKEHWSEVFNIIASAFSEEEYEVKIVSKSNEMAIIQDAIVNNLYHNDVVICDVSCGNPNVMFELGMRLAFDKPTIVIKDQETPYTFDTAPIRHIEYPRTLRYQSILDFKKKIKISVDELIGAERNTIEKRTFLSNFGNLTAAKVQDKELPQGQYIISKLDNLTSKIDNLERNHLVKTPSITTFNEIKNSQKRFGDIIEEALIEYANQHDLDLEEDMNKLPDMTIGKMKEYAMAALMNEHKVKLSRPVFNKLFEEACISASLPFKF